MRCVVASLVLVLAACASKPPPHPFNDLIGREGVVTLTNLHPDEVKSRLYATNYQQIGLIPVCSHVMLLALTTKSLRFRDEATGRTYEYLNHDAAGEPFPDHLTRYFGTECPGAVASLGEIDKRGVTLGKAIAGMSKQGVVFAMGYPPPHVTHSLDSNRWIYWVGRFQKEAVVFDDGGRVLVVDQR